MDQQVKRYTTDTIARQLSSEVQRQEQPQLRKEKGCFQVDKPHEGKVWVYLENEKQTMLFPED